MKLLKQNLKNKLLKQRLSKIKRNLRNLLLKKPSKIKRMLKCKLRKLLKRKPQKKNLRKRLLRRKKLKSKLRPTRKPTILLILNKHSKRKRMKRNKDQLLKN